MTWLVWLYESLRLCLEWLNARKLRLFNSTIARINLVSPGVMVTHSLLVRKKMVGFNPALWTFFCKIVQTIVGRRSLKDFAGDLPSVREYGSQEDLQSSLLFSPPPSNQHSPQDQSGYNFLGFQEYVTKFFSQKSGFIKVRRLAFISDVVIVPWVPSSTLEPCRT